MLPENRLSTTPMLNGYLKPDGARKSITKDKEYGGIHLQDSTRGLFYQIWSFEIFGTQVLVSADNYIKAVLFTHSSIIKEISCTFDQNMNPCVAFVDELEVAWLYWFDTQQNDQVFSNMNTDLDMGEDVVSPRVCLDDKRQTQSATSDIILSYIKNRTLYMRRQRDRFGTAFLLAYRVNAKILDVGMNRSNRLQFKLKYEGIGSQDIPPPVDPGTDPGIPDTGTPGIPPPPGGGIGPIIPPPVIPPPYYPPSPPTPPSVPLDTNLLAGLTLANWIPVPLGGVTQPVPGTFVWEVNSLGTGEETVAVGFRPMANLYTYYFPIGPIPVETITFTGRMKVEILASGGGLDFGGTVTAEARSVSYRSEHTVETQTVSEETFSIIRSFPQPLRNIDIDGADVTIASQAYNAHIRVTVSDLVFSVHRDPMPAMSIVSFDKSPSGWVVVPTVTVYYSSIGTGVTFGNDIVTKVDTLGGGYASVADFENTHDFGGRPAGTWYRFSFTINATRPFTVAGNPGATGLLKQFNPVKQTGAQALGDDIPMVVWMKGTSESASVKIGGHLRCVYNSVSSIKDFVVQTTDTPPNLPIFYP